jgi:hypothetical protein
VRGAFGLKLQIDRYRFAQDVEHRAMAFLLGWRKRSLKAED